MRALATGDFSLFVALLLAAFLPPLLFAVRLRNAERHRREPWQALGKAFLWGAFGATLLAVLFESLLFPLLPADEQPLVPEGTEAGAEALVLAGAITLAAVVVAPLVEELTKAMGLRFVRDEDPEPEDGAIYGGMMGLGFAGTETAFYIAIAYGLQGIETAAATAIVRGVATVSLHGASTAISGHGYWQARHGGRRGAFLGALLVAMLFHGAYNALASIDALYAMAGAILLALGVWGWVRRRVGRLDRAGAPLY